MRLICFETIVMICAIPWAEQTSTLFCNIYLRGKMTEPAPVSYLFSTNFPSVEYQILS